jgi:HK97 family phage prohead protease
MATKKMTYELSGLKTLPDSDGRKGQFEAIVSVFGNVDYQGDKVIEGAFDGDLKRWRDSGDPIPIIWSHEWGDPFAHIGKADPNDVVETARGLKVRGQLDVDKPFAKQVYDLMSERRIKEFSFAYDIPAGGQKPGKDGANELHKLGIIEVGPTLKGANNQTELLGVKSMLEHAAHENDAAWVLERMKELGIAEEGLTEELKAHTGATGGLREHLTAAKPKGHGLSSAEGDDLEARHNRMHDEGADHDKKSFEDALLGFKAGNPEALISWFNDGADGQINWGSPGDFDACVAVAEKHMDTDQAKGFCNERHQDAVGGPPGSEKTVVTGTINSASSTVDVNMQPVKVKSAPRKLEKSSREWARLEQMHATLLSLGYDACHPETLDGSGAAGSDEIKAALGERAEESAADAELRLKARLAELSA